VIGARIDRQAQRPSSPGGAVPRPRIVFPRAPRRVPCGPVCRPDSWAACSA